MENKKHHIEDEEINNPAQFQVGRASGPEKEHDDQDENSYTPQESEFADGKGTPLNEELGETTEDEASTPDDKEED